MALEMVLDTLDGLSEDIAKEYIEKDGKFVLDVNGSKLKSALESEREQRADTERQLKKLKKEKEDAEREALERKQKYKELYETERTRNTDLISRYERKAKEAVAGSIAAKLVKDVKRAKLLKAQILPKLEFDDKEDKVTVQDGLSMDDFVTTLTEEYDFLIDGHQSSGGGAAGSSKQKSSSNKKTVTTSEFLKMNEVDRITFVRENGPDAVVQDE